MPKTFEVDVESPISTTRVLDAFGTAAYWHDRFETSGTRTVVDQLTVHDTGRVDIVTVQDLRRDGLPSLLTKVYRGICRSRRLRRGSPGETGMSPANSSSR